VLTNTIVDIHRMSRRSYGSPRVHAELRLGQGRRCSRKRVERLMRKAGITGIYRRKYRGCTRRDPGATPAKDLVNRRFAVDEADRLWVMDVTEHPSDEGKVYLGVVVDAFSRRVVGWSIADHMRSELVVDAVQMAVWRRRPPAGQTIAHSDHGSQDNSPRGRSRPGRVVPGWSPPWAASGTAMTMPSSSRSGGGCKPSCSTGVGGEPESSWPTPCSNTSKSSTIANAATPRLACSHRPTTSSLTPNPSHDRFHHPKSTKPGEHQTVRQIGGSSSSRWSGMPDKHSVTKPFLECLVEDLREG
jgi:putative transposase